jgi:hypothetical protein
MANSIAHSAIEIPKPIHICDDLRSLAEINYSGLFDIKNY